MHILYLDNDVFEIILSYVEPHNALGLAMTCRAAYVAAMPRFLSEVKIPWDDTHLPYENKRRAKTSLQRVTDFCTFMLADIHRITFLRKLVLSGTAFRRTIKTEHRIEVDYPPDVALLMAQVLFHAVRIKAIALFWMDEVLTSQARLVDALCALSGVVSLSLVGTHINTIPWARMASRLRKLHISLETSHYQESEHFATAMSQECNASIESLQLEKAAVKLASHPGNNFNRPSIHDLVLADGEVDDFQALSLTLPNINSIHIRATTFRNEDRPATWSKLDCLRVRLGTRFAVALECSIRQLVLEPRPGWRLQLGELRYLLQQTSPVVMLLGEKMTLNVRYLRCIAKAVPGLRYLHICLDFSVIPGFDPRSACARQISAFQASSLVGIHITLNRWAPFDATWLATIAQSVAASIEALQYVGFSDMHRPSGSVGPNRSWFGKFLDGDPASPRCRYRVFWYRVISRVDEHKPTIVALTQWEGDAVERQLLDLSRN